MPEETPHGFYPASCDSFFVEAERSSSAAAIFAKNSDRPPMECQPLTSVPAGTYGANDRLRCQYIEIDQAGSTYAVLGSRPYWLWGFEHGLNECGVVVGNHSIYTKDPVAEVGLLGMDLVRLALERGKDREQAVDVIIEHLERYGQGGSGYSDLHWPYHNSFLVADSDGAWLLEASAANWALKEITGTGSATNHTTITTDWKRLSSECEQHAREQGWWQRGQDSRFDFAAAYRDASAVPPIISLSRHERACALAGASKVSAADVRALMRDHNDGKPYFSGSFSPDQNEYYSVCAHGGGLQSTTASAVVEYPRRDGELTVYWGAFANPCVTPYLPLFVEGRLPGELSIGGDSSEVGGMWWRLKGLQAVIEQDLAVRAPVARAFWDGVEKGFSDDVASLQEAVVSSSGGADVAALTSELMDSATARTLAGVEELSSEFGAGN